MGETYYPSEDNMGKECMFWQGPDTTGDHSVGRFAVGCMFPKREMEGRLSCEGIIDDVCLFLKNGRRPKSLTKEQMSEIRRRVPDGDNRDLPPGDIY